MYSLYSVTKTNYSTKIPLTVQLLKWKKKNSHLNNFCISSFKLFHLFLKKRVYWGFDLMGALMCYWCRQYITEWNIAVFESSVLWTDKKSSVHGNHNERRYIEWVPKYLAEHHSQLKGILHDCLGSSNRALKICKRYLLVQRARGTVFTNATKMCLFHLFRQTAIAAMFW